MASIWFHDRTKTVKLIGHMPMENAKAHFKWMLDDYKRRSGGSFTMVDGLEALVMGKSKKIIGGLYIEPHSPPSAAEPGQPKRATA